MGMVSSDTDILGMDLPDSETRPHTVLL